MAHYGHLTQAQADALKATPVPATLTKPTGTADTKDDYYVEQVKQILLNQSTTLGNTYTERYNALFQGGLKIYTNLDPRLQDLAEQKVAAGVPANRQGFTAALASIEPSTGKVRAIVGGPGFDTYKYDLATQAFRQPGSGFKLFTLLAAYEAGYGPDDSVDGSSPCAIDFPGDTRLPQEAGQQQRGQRHRLHQRHRGDRQLGQLRLSPHRPRGGPAQGHRHGPPAGADREVHRRCPRSSSAPRASPSSRWPPPTPPWPPTASTTSPASSTTSSTAPGRPSIKNNPAGKRVLDPADLPHGRGDARAVVQYGTGTAAALPDRPVGRQDGHDRAEHRRLVQRLHPAAGHLGLDGRPQRPHPDVRRRRDHRLRRHLSGPDLARLHRGRPQRAAGHRLPRAGSAARSLAARASSSPGSSGPPTTFSNTVRADHDSRPRAGPPAPLPAATAGDPATRPPTVPPTDPGHPSAADDVTAASFSRVTARPIRGVARGAGPRHLTRPAPPPPGRAPGAGRAGRHRRPPGRVGRRDWTRPPPAGTRSSVARRRSRRTWSPPRPAGPRSTSGSTAGRSRPPGTCRPWPPRSSRSPPGPTRLEDAGVRGDGGAGAARRRGGGHPSGKTSTCSRPGPRWRAGWARPRPRSTPRSSRSRAGGPRPSPRYRPTCWRPTSGSGPGLGGVGAARLVGPSCTGCHLTLPAQELDRIRREPPDALVFCDQCGRILVR